MACYEGSAKQKEVSEVVLGFSSAYMAAERWNYVPGNSKSSLSVILFPASVKPSFDRCS